MTVAPPPDETTASWWQATTEHRLVVQACAGCGHVQHPPRGVCLSCGDPTALTWRDDPGTGAVDAATVVARTMTGFDPPYVVARVRLDSGPILLSNLEAPEAPAPGTRVRLAWRGLADGRALPVFIPDTTHD